MATSPTETSNDRMRRLYGDRIDFDRTPSPTFTTETSDQTMERVYGPRLELPTTLGQETMAVARGMAEGGLRDSPAFAGGVGGATLGIPWGVKAAPFLGPFATLIPTLTTGLGIYGGYKAGQEAKTVIPPETDPRLMAARAGGVTTGSALFSAPWTFGIPVANPATTNRLFLFLSEMGKTARRNPKTFLVGEASVALSMGGAGVIAEANYPGQEGVRAGAEIVGAITNPATLFVKAVDLTKTALSAGKTALGGQSAQTEKTGTEIVRKLLEGYDPENLGALVKELRKQLPSGVPSPTAGQKTGNQVLMDMEASLASFRAQFGGEIGKQGENARVAYQLLIENLERTGDPAALRAVSEMNKLRFDNILQTRLEMAEANAAAKFSRISVDTPEARGQLGVILKREVDQALDQARGTERKLWEASIQSTTKPVKKPGQNEIRFMNLIKQENVPTNRAPTLAPSATITSFLERASGMGPAVFDEIPKPLRDIMASFGVNQNTVARYEQGKLTDAYLATGTVPQEFMPKMTEQPIKNLVDYRSTLLSQGRKIAATGDRDTANFINSVANGMMRDLDTLQDPAYDQARQFSRSLNDVFTRTYANTLESTATTGANRMAPETLVADAFSAGADQTALRMQEIEGAVGFMRTAYRDAVKKFGVDSPEALALQPQARIAVTNVASVREAHNRVLRLAASEALTPVFNKETGQTVQRLNTTKLNEFVNQNKTLLDRLGITRDLENATQAANLLSQVTNPKSILNLKADNQAKFGSLLSSESPTIVVTAALSGKFPVRDIKNLVNVAKKAGPNAPAALDGLKTTILDYAYTKAGGNSATERFSVDAFEAALFDPLGRNQPSLINIMRANDLMTLQEASNFKKLITPMQRIETAARNNVSYEDVIGKADVLSAMGTRIVGAGAGGAVSKKLGLGSSLIASSAGSTALQDVMNAIPNASVRTFLEETAKDPIAMALVVQKARNAKEATNIRNKFINILGSYGIDVGKKAITPALNYQEAQEEQEEPLTPKKQTSEAAQELSQFDQSLRQVQKQQRTPTVAPTTRGVPGLSFQPAAPGQPSASSGAPINANARSQLQALFPNDGISNLAAQQQQQQQQQQPPALR